MDEEGRASAARSMADLHVSLDAETIDAGVGRRKLRTIEPDGTLTYHEAQLPDVKLTETLGRIWAEYPNGMLDVSEDAIAQKDPDASAVEESKSSTQVETPKANEDIMSAEDMAQMRDTILAQLNQSRNELWFVFELAKSLNLSGAYTNNPPPPPSLNPRHRPPPRAQTGPAVRPDNPRDPLVLPAGTLSTTPSKPRDKELVKEVMELEIALAAKQAALEECGLLIDNAVEELTSMSAAGDRFWRDVRVLKHGGRNGRDQWAIVPKPDFGGNAAGQKAKDVIIPYAIDEASSGMRARCLAAFDLDPKKKELAFGARTFLRLKMTLVDENGLSASSTLQARLPDDAEVAKKMDEVQMESFDEELFGEVSLGDIPPISAEQQIRSETLRRGSGTVEQRLVQFDIGEQSVTFELVDTSALAAGSASNSPLCDFMLLSTRLSFLQTLRNRKRRLVTSGSTIPPSRSPLVLHPLAQMLQYRRLTAQVVSALETIQRTLSGAGIKSYLATRMSLDTPEAVVRMLEEGTTDTLGGISTLDIDGCPGIMVQTTAPISIFVDTSRASFPIADPSELIPVLADAISVQLLSAVFPTLKEAAGDQAAQMYLSDLEESITLQDKWSLSISIPAPYDLVQARLDDGSGAYDSRHGDSLDDWVGGLMSRIDVD